MRKIIIIIGLVISFSLGCGMTDEEEDIKKFREELAKIAKAKGLKPEDAMVWRAEILPDLLLDFAKDNVETWRNSKDELSKNILTPKYIVKNLKSENVYSIANRKYLAREGLIYKTLASFNSNQRKEWTDARKILMNMDAETQDRCIFNLILRLNNVPVNTKDGNQFGQNIGKIDKNASIAEIKSKLSLFRKEKQAYEKYYRDSFKKQKTKMSYQRSFWASEELVTIGPRAVELLIQASLFLYTPQFTELVLYTLAQIGEPAVPALIQELKNSDKMRNYETIFFRKRQLIKTLGKIYEPKSYVHLNYEGDDLAYMAGKYDDWMKKMDARENLKQKWYKDQQKFWQTNGKYLKNVVKELTIQVRDYVPDTESKVYIFYVDIISSFRKIGNVSACIPLVEMWKKSLEDDQLVIAIRTALLDISGRNITKLADWKKFASTLTDPEDF